IEGLTEGLKAVSEGLIAQLSQAYAALAAAAPVIATGELKIPPGTVIQQLPPGAAAPAGAAPAPTAFVGVPTTGPGPAAAPGAGAPAMPGPAQGAVNPAAAPGLRMLLGGAATGGATAAGIGEAVPVGYGVSTTEDKSWLPITDGWTDADFDREWEKYKNLPLKDRRSGKERRISADRRKGPDALRKDRRSGFDRRKNDLFKERDEFLKKLEKHKENKKKLEEAQKNKEKKPEKAGTAVMGKGPLVPEIRIENAVINIGEPEKDKAPEPPTKEPEPLKEEEEKKPEPVEEAKAEEPPEEEEEEEPRAEKPPPLDDLPKLGFPSAIEQDLEPVVMVAEAPEGAAEAGAAEAAPAEAVAEGLGEGVEEIIEPEEGAGEEKKEPEKPAVQEIHGILELKPPEEDDAPFLTLTYDFTKIPNSFKLSRDYHTMEYAYYKYKPMLIKAQEFTRRKMLKNALNYYRVIKSQNIPPEFKRMVNRNIKDITDYLEKFLMSRG
ncbi:MAG: hypothetical protein HY042_02485, partial [Spirochaetia bacterium]|nr:hypothetical protein [Spirochaetia bacterium]